MFSLHAEPKPKLDHLNSLTCFKWVNEVQILARYAKPYNVFCIEKQIVVACVIRVPMGTHNIMNITALNSMMTQTCKYTR